MADDQIDLRDDQLVAHANGRACKRMLFTPRGELAMIDPARGH